MLQGRVEVLHGLRLDMQRELVGVLRGFARGLCVGLQRCQALLGAGSLLGEDAVLVQRFTRGLDAALHGKNRDWQHDRRRADADPRSDGPPSAPDCC